MADTILSSSLNDAIEAEVERLIDLRMVGSESRILNVPEGDTVTLSELLAYNDIVLDFDNVTVVAIGGGQSKAMNANSTVDRGVNSLAAGTTQPNG